MPNLHTLKEAWIHAAAIYGEHSSQAKAAGKAYQQRRNQNATRRAHHAAYADLGMVRVKGALGGTYYE